MKHRIIAHLTKKMKYNVVEIFESINGEGMKAGELAVFIRLKGCNLKCSYCDTAWANTPDAIAKTMTIQEIIQQTKKYGTHNITVTGGEPLLQNGIEELLSALAQEGSRVEIETNGSIFIEPYRNISENIVFTMDYKLAGSGMEKNMEHNNFELLRKDDSVKFVVSDITDLERAFEIANKYREKRNFHILLSPVFGKIEMEEIVDFMKEKNWTDARMQIQMHKVIWDPQKRGV